MNAPAAAQISNDLKGPSIIVHETPRLRKGDEILAKNVVNSLKRIEENGLSRAKQGDSFFGAVQNLIISQTIRTQDAEHTEITITEAVVTYWEDFTRQRSNSTTSGIAFEEMSIRLTSILAQIQKTPKTNGGVIAFLKSKEFHDIWYDIVTYVDAIGAGNSVVMISVLAERVRDPILTTKMESLRDIAEIEARTAYILRKTDIKPEEARRLGFG
jgi:hypothetical protein